MKILDSDHCIAVLRQYISLDDFVQPRDALAITAVTLGELLLGALKSDRPQTNLARVEILITPMSVLPFDGGAARHYAHLRALLEKDGMIIDDLDLQIAAIAIHLRLPLVSHNQRHFKRISRYSDLILEDWLA